MTRLNIHNISFVIVHSFTFLETESNVSQVSLELIMQLRMF